MNKLIPLSEYVLQEKTMMIESFEQPGTTSDDFCTYKNFIAKIFSYTEFLRQPLTLSMFVPVDKQGNVLTEPTDYEYYISDDEQYFNGDEEECQIYSEAMEKVLFEGFKLMEGGLANTVINDEGKRFYLGGIYNHRIEDKLSHNLTLTPSALKLIGKE